MNKQRLRLIINPISGTINKNGLAEIVSQRVESQMGMSIDVRITNAKGDATVYAQEAVKENYYGVIALGGDGTVNEVASALCGSDVVLGIIPTGSGNGLARHLGIPVDAKMAVNVILQNNVVACDYAIVNDHPFFCTFGVGFDAAVSERFAKQKKRGSFMYVKSAFEEYRGYKPKCYTISANGKIITEEALIVACCNSSQYGNNAYIAPMASMTDGLLDIIIVHAGSPLNTAVLGVDLFTGYINRNTLIQSFKAPEAVIYRSEEGPAHVDGEPLSFGEVMDVKCRKGGLKIFVPQKKRKKFRPIITPLNNLIQDTRIAILNCFSNNKK